MTKTFAGFLLFAVLLTGCLSDREHFGTPNLLHPGHIDEQRSRMQRFDPFTRSDIGPAIPGDRPGGCTAPTPSSQHIQEYRESR